MDDITIIVIPLQEEWWLLPKFSQKVIAITENLSLDLLLHFLFYFRLRLGHLDGGELSLQN